MQITRISHLKLLVTVPEKPPQEMIDDYIKGYRESPDKGYKHARETVPDVEAVIEKVIKPSIKGTKDSLNPNFVTRSGMKVKNIPPPTRAEMEKWARNYLKGMEYAFRDGGKEYLAIIKLMAEIYGKRMRPTLAITGFKDKIRGVSRVAARCLTGDESVLPLILPEEMIKGPLINVILEGREGRFSSRLNSQLISDGSQIIDRGYQPGDIIEGNANINELGNSYARKEFVPFTPNGASHIAFMVTPLVGYHHGVREDRQLFLEIVVSVP